MELSMKTGAQHTRRAYAAMFLAWTLMGLFLFSQGIIQKVLAGDPNPWWHHLTSWMVGMWLWFLFTPLVMRLGRRFPLGQGWRLRTIGIHLGLAIVVSVVDLAVEAVVLHALRLFPAIMSSFTKTFAFLMIIGFHQGLLMYWTILGVQYAFGWYRRYEERRQEALRLELRSSELERELVQAHLSALKMQLHPHFLFNTLNAIMVLVRQGKGSAAEEMLARLSDLLRCALEDVEAQEVPFSRELEYLQLYLAIEQVRFQDRLRVEFAVDPETLEAAVPYMSLQPIVENAIRHGIGRSSSAGLITISASAAGGSLEIRVEDDGPGMKAANGAPSRGIGLANTRARLERLYGEAAHLAVENGPAGGVVATMTLPYRPVEAHATHGAVG
jgi:two-component system, LytTR family, sensor kinase